jgi:hypothetical protein
MKIEIILLGVIGLVFLVDFIMNSRKKPSIDNVVDQIEGGEPKKREINKKSPINILTVGIFFIVLNVIIFLIPTFQGVSISDSFQIYGEEINVNGLYLKYYHLFWLNTVLLLFIPLLIGSQLNNHESNILGYLSKRKRNFSLYILSIPLTKVLIHYMFYPIMTQDIVKAGIRNSRSSRDNAPAVYSQSYKDSVGEHIDAIFTDELLLFIPAFILVSLAVWFFNDKIKAR